MLKTKANTKMNKLILCLIVIMLASCSSEKNMNEPGKDVVVPDTINNKTKADMRFNFRTVLTNAMPATFLIHATLYNNHTDTAYFLSTTCEGEQYSLRYDTSKFELTPSIVCNITHPKIIKIAPKEQHSFSTYFRSKNVANNIKLGFDFYAVDRSFKLEDAKQIKIYNRPPEQQNIIWADEKRLQ